MKNDWKLLATCCALCAGVVIGGFELGQLIAGWLA